MGQDHSFCLNATVTSESSEANANYLQSHSCGAETKEARLSQLLLAQEPSFKPVTIQAERQSVCECACTHTRAWRSVGRE